MIHELNCACDECKSITAALKKKGIPPKKIKYTDKTILIIRAGKYNLISVNGKMAQHEKKPMQLRNTTKIIKEGTRIEKQYYEVLKYGEEKAIIYNGQTNAWSVKK